MAKPRRPKVGPKNLFLTRTGPLLISGMISALAFAPYHFWPLCSLSLVVLLWFLDQDLTPQAGARTLWLWGFGHFFVAFHWMSFSLGVDLGKFAWLIPIALVGPPLILASLLACVGALTVALTPPAGFKRFFFLIGAWGLEEWLRGHFLVGGFGWNVLGSLWGGTPAMLQTLSFWGVYGLSLCTLLLLASPYLWIAPWVKGIQRFVYTSFTLLGGFCLLAYGTLRIKPVSFVSGPWMRLCQPNIDQKDKYDPGRANDHIRKLFALSLKPSDKPITHLLWPEAALPFVLTSSDLRGARLPLTRNQFLLTGILRVTQDAHKKTYVWNSLMVFNGVGRTLSCYDKSHLVPFGEYIPLRNFLNRWTTTHWMKAISMGSQDITPGPGIQTLSIPKAPDVSPLICFEVLFPGNVTASPRPGWLLDVTNDAWFQDSWGLPQHFELGQLRAVEEGLPLVRVANTGISGVIDPYGQITAILPSLEEGVLDFALPNALPETFYSRFKDIPFFVLALCFLGIAFLKPRTRRRFLTP